MTETGIYGGSFNPIHRGHVELAERLCRDEGLDELWFMVSPQNPFKKSSPDLLNENIPSRSVPRGGRLVALMLKAKFKSCPIR